MENSKNLSLLFSSLITFLISYLVFAWQEPTLPPPQGNIPAPLNVSLQAQSKEGALVLGNNPSVTTGLIVRYGNVGIGTTAPSEKLHIFSNTNLNLLLESDGGNADFVPRAYGAARPGISGYKARGTASSPSAVQADDILLFFGGRGYGATAWPTISNGAVLIKAGGTFTDTSYPTYITFETTPSGSTSRQERVRIDPSGNVGIGTTTPSYKLDIVGDINLTSSSFIRIAGNPGSPGQVLTRTSSGMAWQTPSGGQLPTCSSPGQWLMWDGSNWVCSGSSTIVGPQTKFVFVTSTLYNGNLKTAGGGIDGIDGANRICQQRANAACSANPSSPLCGRTFRAWVSTQSIPAYSNIECANNKIYTLLNGTVIANGCSSLIDGNIDNPIRVTEFGGTIWGFDQVWTGTTHFGNPANWRCGDWQNTGTYGNWGRIDRTDYGWTYLWSGGAGDDSCSYYKHLYCFEI
jgi:hypothetical protein